MTRLRNWWKRTVRDATRPTSPERSISLAEYERTRRESDRSDKMAAAIEKERVRRGMAF